MLQSECSVLSENLERRRQEAEELEGYCSQLKVSFGRAKGQGEGCGFRKRGGNGVGGHERVGEWKVAQDRLKEKVIPLSKGARLLRDRTIGRGQILDGGEGGFCCLVIWGGACMEIRGEGQGGRTGMGRQGPCPGVLTQENCRKVTRSVEDAEIKTNVLKQNSALLEVRGWGWGVPGLGTGCLIRLQVELAHPTITLPLRVHSQTSLCTVIVRPRGRLVLDFEWECPCRPYAHTSSSKMLEKFQWFFLNRRD